VIGCLPSVFFTLPGEVGFFVVGLIGGFAAASYLLGWNAVRAGKPLPLTLTARARRGLAAEVARRRGNTPPRGRPVPRAPSLPRSNSKPRARP
jgi:hypothetical protein